MAKTDSLMEENKDKENTGRTALTRAMALCASREYCSDDIRGKLISWGIRDQEIEKIITRLKTENFIDDKRYAEAFVKDKFSQNKWGKIKISALLRARRIPSDMVESALSVLDEEEYRQTARDIITSHRRTVRAKNNYELKGKLLRFGLSRGFESHILYDILNETDLQ